MDKFLPQGLSLGPRSTSDLDSFLHPFLEELKLLREGVPAYDAYKEEAFILKAHLVLITGDTPAISKLLCFSGHSSKLPCRACKIEGVPFKIGHKKKNGQAGETTHRYFALLPPTRFPQHFTPADKSIYRLHPSYTVNDLPLRTPSNYRSDALAGDSTMTGVKGISPLSLIPTIQVPYSCPYDVMHLVYLGFVRDLCRRLSGSFFKDKTLNLNSPISNNQWQELGREMGKWEKLKHRQLGDGLRGISQSTLKDSRPKSYRILQLITCCRCSIAEWMMTPSPPSSDLSWQCPWQPVT